MGGLELELKSRSTYMVVMVWILLECVLQRFMYLKLYPQCNGIEVVGALKDD
jgi:hypothetical protein